MGGLELLGIGAQLQQPVGITQQGIAITHMASRQGQADDGEGSGICDFSLLSFFVWLSFEAQPVSMSTKRRGKDGVLHANGGPFGRSR